jgi:4-diphosphocytidyl-2-C-methyl-D-erythritol kinase
MSLTDTDSGTRELARAKVNLALHVTGRREDGYHLLDSLVVFPNIGDELSLAPAAGFELRICGPQAGALSETPKDNLVARAVRGFAERTGCSAAVRISLDKRLPVASGIGGGSADAAAAIRLMERHTGIALPEKKRDALALSLGADVPVCLGQQPSRMRGIGEIVEPVPGLPECGIVLVNPGEAVSTPDVFRKMVRRNNRPLPDMPATFTTLSGFLDYLEGTRNDMQEAAAQVCPAINQVIGVLEGENLVRMARMSGSGATCFGLCTPGDEQAIAGALQARNRDWWVMSGRF